MTPTPYTPEMRAADARIAVAMGWTQVKVRDWDRDGCISDCTGHPSVILTTGYPAAFEFRFQHVALATPGQVARAADAMLRGEEKR